MCACWEKSGKGRWNCRWGRGEKKALAVILRGAKDLSRWQSRFFAALRMARSLLQRIAHGGGDGGEDQERKPGGQRWGQPAAGAERLATERHDHEHRDDSQRQANRNKWIAIRAGNK